MKLTLLIILLFSVHVCFAQHDADRKQFREGHQKLEELEKVKLIEALNMDEQTSIKFFARRNAHRQKMQELNEQMQDKTDQIEKLLKGNPDDARLKAEVNEYLDLEASLPRQRAEFIKSLSDILTEEQIARLVIFEKKFREEIRDILFRERGKKGFNRN